MTLKSDEARRTRNPTTGRRRATAIDGNITRTSLSPTVTSSIPPIPSSVEPELRYALEALRASVQVQSDKGQGDPLDAAVTFRDVDLSTGVIVVSDGTGGGGGTTPPSVVEPPTTPTGVSAVSGFGYTIVSWAIPTYLGHSHTNVYVQPYDPDGLPDYNEELGSWYRAATPGGIIDITLDAGEYWVWCRHVNRATTPVVGSPSTAIITEVYEDATNVIDKEWEDAIGELDRITDAAWIDEIINAAAQVGQGTHLIQIDNDLVSINLEITNVVGRVDDHDVEIEGIEGDIEVISGRVSGNANTIGYCQIDGAITSQIDRETCWAADPDWTPPPDYDPDDPDWTPDPDDPWKRLPLGAALDSTYIIIEDPETGEPITSVSITGWQQIHVDENGILKAQWGQKIDFDGIQGGIGIWGDYDPVTGEGEINFVCVADKFTVYHPDWEGGDPQPVFRIVDGTAYLDSVYIDEAFIDEIVAKGITADRINALELNAVSITGGTISIGAGFDVDELGVMTATGANITGTIQSANFAPGVSGWQITNAGVAEFQDGTFRGTIYADEIIGDLVSATSFPLTASITGTAWVTVGSCTVSNNTGDVATFRIDPLAYTLPSSGSSNVVEISYRVFKDNVFVRSLGDNLALVVTTTNTFLHGFASNYVVSVPAGDTVPHTYRIEALLGHRGGTSGTVYPSSPDATAAIFRDGGAFS